MEKSSLGKDIIIITPLVELKANFLRTPYISENFKRINEEMSAEHATPPDEWLKLTPEEKQKRT